MKKIRLLNGRVVEVEDFKAGRLVRKGRAKFIEAAVYSPRERMILPRPVGR